MQDDKHRVKGTTVQNLLEIINQADNVHRYSRDFMIKNESLLTHLGFMCQFVLFMGLELGKRGVKIDIGTALIKATVHDQEEVITGDIVRTTKHSSPDVKAALEAYELKAITQLENVLELSFKWRWKQAKDKESIEGRLVALADIAAVVYKVMTEVSLYGNRSFCRVSDEIWELVTGLYGRTGPDYDSQGRKITRHVDSKPPYEEYVTYDDPQNEEDPLFFIIEDLYAILSNVRNGSIQFGAFFKGMK